MELQVNYSKIRPIFDIRNIIIFILALFWITAFAIVATPIETILGSLFFTLILSLSIWKSYGGIKNKRVTIGSIPTYFPRHYSPRIKDQLGESIKISSSPLFKREKLSLFTYFFQNGWMSIWLKEKGADSSYSSSVQDSKRILAYTFKHKKIEIYNINNMLNSGRLGRLIAWEYAVNIYIYWAARLLKKNFYSDFNRKTAIKSELYREDILKKYS